MMAHALTAAVEAALLVTGEAKYLDLLRMHMDKLVEHGREEGGRLLVPYKCTDEGWTDFNPIDPNAPIHLWTASMEEQDWQRLETLRRGAESEWRQVGQRGPRSLDDRAWTRFLAGDSPDYPKRILQANYREVCDRIAKVIDDEQDLTQLDVHWWQQVNPVVTEALVQLTTGAPQTIYWGGLAQGRVRYFDGEQQRPGRSSLGDRPQRRRCEADVGQLEHEPHSAGDRRRRQLWGTLLWPSASRRRGPQRG